ncbi:uncharacterized protein LOC132543325 [Ylistrum balloti]|uniref:uncharacterized protein LOC132543325 n=1 Tax=Ylistrum balloti TaxID=509963 RepID=UPI002905A1A0|nr:uncharacterized protein LOC132543325 [Ylistrum balloti]
MKVHLVLILSILEASSAFETFQTRIPNGNNIVDPCDSNLPWPGVGHRARGGGGARNPFGIAFAANGMTWTRALCLDDSDGDGQSNGVELGDPRCEWRIRATPAGPPTGHPGVCEPWNSANCMARNGNWLNCDSTGMRCPAISVSGVRQLQFRMPRIPIPATEATFMCVNLEVPADRDYHVIADTAILDNQNIVHHMILFACETMTATELQNPVGSPYPCEMLPDPKCQDIITGWQPGISGFCHPDHLGFSVGANRGRYLSLQVHWINPLRRTGLTDTSGMALFLTPNLRQYNLSTFRIGDIYLSIPPKEKSFAVEGTCASSCTRNQLTGPISVYQSFDHMHYAGREIKVTLKRQGRGPERTLWNNPNFSFQNTVFHRMNGNVQIRPGDSLHTTCRYNTESRNKTTSFGFRATDEMCFAFLQFYPAENAISKGCTSSGGLPGCQLNDPNAVIDGCSVSFTTGPDIAIVAKYLRENCHPVKCHQECINVVKAIRKHACFRNENIRKHIEAKLLEMKLIETLAQLHSCDVEIAMEEANCQSTQAISRTRSTRCLCNKRPFLRWISGN